MEDLMTKTSQEITAGLVTVRHEEHYELAFTAWMDIRIKRSQDWDNESNSSYVNSVQSEPDMIESIAVDEELLARRNSEPTEDLSQSLQGFSDF